MLNITEDPFDHGPTGVTARHAQAGEIVRLCISAKRGDKAFDQHRFSYALGDCESPSHSTLCTLTQHLDCAQSISDRGFEHNLDDIGKRPSGCIRVDNELNRSEGLSCQTD